MYFQIEPSNGVAIYDQVVRQVKFAVADGVLREGELAPSVRELAKQLAINPNTVSRAYNQLQADDVLEPVRGTGLAVRRRAAGRCQKERLRIVTDRLQQTLNEARSSGLSLDEIRSLVDQTYSQLVAAETAQ